MLAGAALQESQLLRSQSARLSAVHLPDVMSPVEHLPDAAYGRTLVSPSASVLPHFVWQIDLTVACPVLLLEHGGVLHVVPDCFLLKHSVLHDPYSSHASALVYLADTFAMDFALEASRVGQVTVPQ